MLQIQDLASRRNGQPFLNGVTLAIPDGQTVLLTGRADCGKSALLRIVGGLEKYSRGTIRFDDLPTHADQLRRIAYFTAKGTLPPFLSADGALPNSLRSSGRISMRKGIHTACGKWIFRNGSR